MVEGRGVCEGPGTRDGRPGRECGGRGVPEWRRERVQRGPGCVDEGQGTRGTRMGLSAVGHGTGMGTGRRATWVGPGACRTRGRGPWGARTRRWGAVSVWLRPGRAAGHRCRVRARLEGAEARAWAVCGAYGPPVGVLAARMGLGHGHRGGTRVGVVHELGEGGPCSWVLVRGWPCGIVVVANGRPRHRCGDGRHTWSAVHSVRALAS